MLKVTRLATVVVACCFMAACETPQYNQMQQGCAAEWGDRIPPDFQQILVNKTRSIQVPDGTSTCTTVGNTTSCKQGMRTEWIPYTVAETVDLNQTERSRQIKLCTRDRCARTYGNPDCKA